MSNPELHLPDKRLQEISRQTRDWREGWVMIPPPLLWAIPSKWRRAVGMWANPPSIKDLAVEVASPFHLEELEQEFFSRSFSWRIGNQQELDLTRRNSSRNPFWTDPDVSDDPELLRKLKQLEEGLKRLIDPLVKLVECAFPQEDSSLVANWLEVSRRAGANLGAVFYNLDAQPAMLRHHMVIELGRISDARAKVPLEVRTYINERFRTEIKPYLKSR